MWRSEQQEESLKVEDEINSPSHYTAGGIETWEFIRAKLTYEEWIGYLKGNIIKYLSRSPYKDSPEKDVQKAQWYMDRLNEDIING